MLLWAFLDDSDDDEELHNEILNFIIYKFRHVPVYGYGAGTGMAMEDKKRRERAYKAFFPPVQWGFNLLEDLAADDKD